ncbi:MAG: hypothetical protein ABJC74_07770 [Gemmatimonadota bacterium]
MPLDRLRTPPDERLSGPVRFLDLAATAAALRQEPHAGVSGHRQITVFRQGPVTVVCFAFDPLGSLKAHQTDGIVTILVVRGHLRVSAAGELHDLRDGQMVGLAPSIPHSVEAVEASEMLLTVCKPTPASAPA